MITYKTPQWADTATMIADLIAGGYELNGEYPDEANLKLNNIVTKDGDYGDFTYLGNIPDEWDIDGNPIGWTDFVIANIASTADIPLGNEYIYQNRYAGQSVDFPEVMPTSLATKAVILDFMQSYYIPNNAGWTKQKLLDELAAFVS